MNEDQADTIIDLLTEISSKLTDLNEKIGDDFEHGSVNRKLKNVVSELENISSYTSGTESNTTNL